MAFKFPFTNYHELNLNWVLEELKKLFEDSEENVTTIETYDERLTAVETELPTVSATAQDAAQNAAAASTAAQQATATANTAQENATQAQSLAGFARQEAQAAQTAADAATQAAQQATATAQNFDGRITQAQNDASTALEASRSFENRVQAAITTANNAANTATNAQGIAMRADQNAALALDTLNAQRAELERIGAEQAALITAETEDKKTEIENLAESVLDSIPADYTELSAQVDKKAPVIIDTAAGSIASFDYGADNMKIQKLVVNIKPVQTGSGEAAPDNVRPISGWTGAEIEQAGKNLVDFSANLYNSSQGLSFTAVGKGGIKITGTKTGSWAIITRPFDFAIPAGSALTLSRKEAAPYNLYCHIDFDDGTSVDLVMYNGENTKSMTLTKNAKTMQLLSSGMTSGETYDEIIYPMLELSSNASDYSPYTGNQISVTFPASAGDSGTVYGGTLTLNPDRTGALVVNRGASKVKNLTWGTSVINNITRMATIVNNIKHGSNNNYIANAISDRYQVAYVNILYSATYNNKFGVSDDGRIFVLDTRYTTVADFVANEGDSVFCYELAEPQTIPLTASEVSGILTTLYGTNNIWADTGDIQSCDYPADTKLYIDGKLAELQATILENI